MKLTAKILAFYFAFGSVLPRTDFSQLMNIPDLFEHFQEHQEKVIESGIEFSFLDFLEEHFVNPDSHEHPDESHKNLPLKTVQSLIDFFFKNDQTNKITLPIILNSVSYFTENLTSFEIGESLFRPPILVRI